MTSIGEGWSWTSRATSTTKWLLASLAVAGCSGSGGQTSSSSHFVECRLDRECLGWGDAMACEGRRCVDPTGTPIRVDEATSVVSVGNDPAGPACDPTAPIQRPVALGELALVAEADDGTVYVTDHSDGGLRLFRSEGSSLLQLDIAGLGAGTNGVVLNVEAASFILTYYPEDDPTEAVLYEGVTDDDAFERMPDAFEGETLRLLEPSALETFDVGALVSPVYVEYQAVSDAGHQVVAVRPEREFQYEDFRVFFSSDAESELVERRLIEVLRAQDGGSTSLTFNVDGAEAVAFFPVNSDGERFVPGDATLIVAEREYRLMQDGMEVRELNDLNFICFSKPPNGWTVAE